MAPGVHAVRTGILFALAVLAGAAAHPADLPDNLRLPPGFRAERLVSVPGARSMALGEQGTLFISTRQAGSVHAVTDPFGRNPQVRTILSGLKMPNGVAFRNGTLYVADQTRLLAIKGAESAASPAAPEAIADLPFKNALHSWRYTGFGPDGLLYISIGAPCNVCDEADFGQIIRMRPDGSAREVVARGVRNSVGFDWHPRTRELWFTDNGRDMLGDDEPPCELNRLARNGEHFGFPFCHGSATRDPQFGSARSCGEFTPPSRALGPHVAPLGMRFYDGRMFPKRYRNQLFVAEHGSWNRSKGAGRTGYRVMLIRFDKGAEPGYEPFIEGFLDGDTVRGRPVDIIVAPDGALLVSDDAAGAIYRVTYTGRR
ncbi:MAG: sorbosone dehydrogenase family protein [Gammaproteobacteria bacterium]|nr:sorbosone dehydrogenase family protein [Gammaproteobacteria bacterium]